MASRLDRLFVLLETGSSAVTRRAAAKQLGEIQRLHPNELQNLLSRITKYLHSSAWETRIAAGQAVEAVISNVPPWNPPSDTGTASDDEEEAAAQAGRMTFKDFDLDLVLANGKQLMASEGTEYDMQEEVLDAIALREKMAEQRQQLNSRLGLGAAAKIGIDMSEIFSSEDLKQSIHARSVVGENMDRQPVCEVVKVGGAMSSREMNRARRKARQAVSKQRSREAAEDGTDEPADRKRVKLEEAGPAVKQEEPELPDVTPPWGEPLGQSDEWPLAAFADRLFSDLWSTSWEARHGAATALREVVRLHGASAGRRRHGSDRLHAAWLEDAALRLACVLALDRFGDFVSDQVVAPVRETAAQALGAVVDLMDDEGVNSVLSLLLRLLDQKEWEARHGGLLGIKYLLAVKQDRVSDLLPRVFPHVLAALSDPTDDVGAVAAAALVPVAAHVGRCLPDQVAPTVARLWDLLSEQDELAAACNSFMSLLAAILLDNAQHLGTQPAGELVPRLWPFLSHGASSVRRATLQTLRTLTADGRAATWTAELLQEAMRHAYQRALVEHVPEIQDIVERVWSNLVRHSQLDTLLMAACPYVSTWLCLSMQPGRVAIDPALIVRPRTVPRTSTRRNKAFQPLETGGSSIAPQEPKLYLGGSETVPLAVREGNVMRARCIAARMMGLLSCYVIQPAPGIVYDGDIESPIDCYVKVLLVYLDSKSALQRMMAGLVIAEGARSETTGVECPASLRDRLHACLNENLYYDEIAASFTRLLQDARDFVAVLKHYKAPIDTERYGKVLTLDQIQHLGGAETQAALAASKLKQKVVASLEERRKAIQSAVAQTALEQAGLTISTQAALAGAVVMLNCLPEKLNPVVKPLMEAIKREENEQLQNLAGEHMARLMELCIDRVPCPNAKIISNLCTFLRSDPEFTPKIQVVGGEGTSNDSGAESMGDGSRTSTPTSFADNYSGILTLVNQQKNAERAAFRRSNSTSGRGPGRPPATDIPLEELFAAEEESHKQFRVQRRGASFALTAIGRYFGAQLPERLPKLWELIIGQLKQAVDPDNFDPAALMNQDGPAEELVSSLQVLEVTSPALHKDLLPQVLSGVSALCSLLGHPYRAVRHMSARCLAALAALSSPPVMAEISARALPLLATAGRRHGAVEALACVVDRLQVDVVPYIVLLVVPLLGCMSDQDQAVRLMATHCFATLVQLMPLDGGVPDPPGLGVELREQKARERRFLEQLFNPKTIEDYMVPVPIHAELRSYQQAGINWLAFLNKYKLHGILCDDMGLGKTLQSICMLAGDHFRRSEAHRLSGGADSAPLPSLVVCPPTLTGHWHYEVEKFLPAPACLHPLQYVGPPVERFKLRRKVKTHNLIIASYDIVRKDIDFFSSIKWNYCILDEGHIIKNGKTKASKAVKQLVANHRLILSGTPIQNNVLELWSLFDFLMPGFLGTEKQFTARYSKPILASRDPKSQPRDQEAGALAMEALHRQVLPFLLRRMKEDVLQDLPPKITQDYYCELSPLQQQLYEDFSRSQAHQSLQERLSHAAPSAGAQTNTTHIFQALRYLQNVCNHPRLVLTPEHPEFARVTAQLAEQKSSLNDIQHSAKLPALQQLLLDCGIGCSDTVTIAPHRALVFCQLKAMLDIVERDLLRRHMPAVSYLRLDGSVAPAARHAVVARFNSDPTIDVLLLTTQVGGLGLNLTGADTVIFVEHDWNPMKDLQAMDRAHRIGQKKVVNVYRLITRATLEEKIMGLQKFKMMTANTVISSENASMETMGTDQLLDLFSLDGSSRDSRADSGGSKAILDTLPELWEDRQYEEEYDITSYVRNLRKL